MNYLHRSFDGKCTSAKNPIFTPSFFPAVISWKKSTQHNYLQIFMTVRTIKCYLNFFSYPDGDLSHFPGRVCVGECVAFVHHSRTFSGCSFVPWTVRFIESGRFTTLAPGESHNTHVNKLSNPHCTSVFDTAPPPKTHVSNCN